MSTLIATANGNLTGATTFAAAEVGSSALQLVRGSTTTIASAGGTLTSSTFTVTSGKVIDGVLLWLAAAGVGTGNFKVDLQKSGVSQASVTVSVADLPVFTSTGVIPVFFKFSGTATGDGAATWTLVLTNSGNVQVDYSFLTTTTNLFRALRTTTTQAPVAGDDLYIVGELSGSGTHNSRAVTMDSTATTAYGNATVNSTSVNGGGIRISTYGSLTYGTSASTNYVLRVAGDVEVYWNGTLSIGASGSEIPRSSTAVLELVMTSASGDFGLQAHAQSTLNIAGLSRTSGKNVVKCKLTADVTNSSLISATATTTNGSTVNSGILDAETSLQAGAFTDNATASATHSMGFLTSGATVTATNQTFEIWLARGTGTNNRFVRMEVGNSSTLASVTNGFFIDLDLSNGTTGTGTAIGNGTFTSCTVTAVGGGYNVRLVGKVSSSSATPTCWLISASALGTTSYTGNASQCFAFDHMRLITGTAGDTTWNVDTDTGWLSGDAIAVASTNKTTADCGDNTINANAGASSIVTTLSPFGTFSGGSFAPTFSGSSPTAGEIGLMTRNVKIRSTSTSLWTYIYVEALATATISWAEFYYFGTSSTTHKHGFELDGATSGPATRSVTFCSFHDCFAPLFLATTTAIYGLTYSNNVSYNASAGITLASNTTGNSDWTLDSNLMIKTTGAAYTVNSVTGTFTNNITSGASGAGFLLTDLTSPHATMGTFTGNVAHSGGGNGMTCSGDIWVGTIGLSAWRNNGNGLSLAMGANTVDALVFNNLVLFGNLTANFQVTTCDFINITGSSIIAGDASFATASGFSINAIGSVTFDVVNLDMSGSGTGLAPHTTQDILTSVVWSQPLRGTFNNCKFGAPALLSSKTFWSKNNYLGFEKYNQVSGDHRTEMTYGQLRTDSTQFNFSSPSLRMTPSNASNKLESAPKGKGWLVPVSNGNPAALSAYLYKSKNGDGAAYNGNQPRLIQRANPALGQNSDVVLATYGSSTGSWNQISGNTSTPTDDGAFEIIIDCDGTQGWINIDDLQAA